VGLQSGLQSNSWKESRIGAGKKLLVVSQDLRENRIDIKDERVERLAQQGKTVVFLLEEGRPMGAIALADIIRKESREAIERLKSMNVKCMMLTGDNKFVAQWVESRSGRLPKSFP
jgi:Cu2+-exporting ATPase